MLGVFLLKVCLVTSQYLKPENAGLEHNNVNQAKKMMHVRIHSLHNFKISI